MKSGWSTCDSNESQTRSSSESDATIRFYMDFLKKGRINSIKIKRKKVWSHFQYPNWSFLYPLSWLSILKKIFIGDQGQTMSKEQLKVDPDKEFTYRMKLKLNLLNSCTLHCFVWFLFLFFSSFILMNRKTKMKTNSVDALQREPKKRSSRTPVNLKHNQRKMMIAATNSNQKVYWTCFVCNFEFFFWI